ncbi:MAG: hypothetical protein HW421_90 [Ignavibacteria bacterium]|nr:hypothetical protein [Ignavibacteria bacterium]
MILRIISIYIAFLWIYTLHAEPISITTNPQGMIIKINHLDAWCSSDENRNIQLQLEKSRYLNYRNFENGDRAYFLEFYIAAPTGNVKATFTNKQYRNLNCNSNQHPPVIDLIQNIETVYAGKQRDVNIVKVRVNPYAYDNTTNSISVLDSSEIFIEFSTTVPIILRELPPLEKSFYCGVNNQAHLPALLNDVNNTKQDNQLLSEDTWYVPARKYIAIPTSKDGIAAFKMKDVIAIDGTLNGKESRYLHLLNRGVEQLIAIIDEDSIIDNKDEIYFYGSRPKGDTTWFDAFASKEMFYLYYDNLTEGKRLEDGLYTNGEPDEIKSVDINWHLEKDNDYAQQDPGLTEASISEGWYIRGINDTNPSLQNIFFYQPTDNPEDSVEISSSFNSILELGTINGKSFFYNYYLSFLLNNDTLAQKTFQKMRQETFVKKLASTDLFPGINGIEHFTLTNDSNKYQLVGIDYYNVNGKAKPAAYNGTVSFATNPKKYSILKIDGFSSHEIVAIDTLNKIIYYPLSRAGTMIQLGVRSGAKQFASVRLNDSGFGFFKPGIDIVATTEFSKSVIQQRYYSQDTSDIIGFIDSLPAQSIVVMCINKPMVLSQQLIRYLEKYGIKDIGQVANGQSYACIFRKSGSLLFEKASPDVIKYSSFLPNTQGVSYSCSIDLFGNSNHNFCVSDSTAIEFSIPQATAQTNLRNRTNSADAIIITHKDFLQASERLAAHRLKYSGINEKIIDVDEIYKEFYYGRKSAHAIKSFLKFAVNNWAKKPTHVTFMGDASDDPRMAYHSAIMIDYVPTYGNPVSDSWYSFLDNDRLGDIIVGRIPAQNPKQANEYLDKVILYDTIPIRPWMKKFLFISGGLEKSEILNWCNYIMDFKDRIVNSQLCADTARVCKDPDDTGVSEKAVVKILEFMNNGVIWTNFLGHGAATVMDLDGWTADRFNNGDRMGILTNISCNVGNFAIQFNNCKNEDYVMYPKKGFVAAIGSTGTGDVTVGEKLLDRIFENMSDPLMQERNVGALLYMALNQFVDFYKERDGHDQMALLGDPLINVRIPKEPDIYFLDNEAKASPANLSENDSLVTINMNLYNGGILYADTFRIRVIRINNNYKDTLFFKINGICRYKPITFQLNIKNMPGNHVLSITADPDGITTDKNMFNNTTIFIFFVAPRNLLPLDPLANWDVSATKPVFRLINSYPDSLKLKYGFQISIQPDTSTQPFYISKDAEIDKQEDYIDWLPEYNFKLNTNYWLGIWLEGLSGVQVRSWNWLPFHTVESIGTTVNWIQASSQDSITFKIQPKFQPYYILGLKGNSTNRNWSRISIGDEIYWNDNRIEGFNIVTYSTFSGATRKKWFNTSYIGDNLTNPADSLYYFLRDSVSNNEFLLLTLNGNAYNLLNTTKAPEPGCLDSIKAILKRYGSRLAGDIGGENSFSMVGRKGSPIGSINEKINQMGDTTELQGFLFNYPNTGSFLSEKIGPAKLWMDIKLKGYLPKSDSINYLLKIFGVSKKGTVQLDSAVNSFNLDISGIDAKKYPYLKFQFDINRKNTGTGPYITKFECNFVPTPELTVVKSKTKLQPETILRADYDSLFLTVHNISLRTSSDSAIIDVKAVSQQSETKFDTTFKSFIINSGKLSDYILPIPTETYNKFNDIQINADINQYQNELYYFNNELQRRLEVFEDTIPPTVEIYCDGKRVFDKDYVSIQPEVQIYVYDNSRLNLTEASIVNLRINSKKYDKYKFMATNDKHPLKAIYSFRSDSLFDKEDNYFVLIVSDATGNYDTVKFVLKVAFNGNIDRVFAYPNPFTETTTISFNLQLPQINGSINIEIYNSIGSKVKTLNPEFSVGINNVIWDGRDDAGIPVAQGIYYFWISYSGYLFIEPANGIISFVK